MPKSDMPSATAAKPSRRERNRQRNREEILASALQVFAEKGFHSASIQEIAERAEFALGTIYSLFDSKEEIYRALLIDQAEQAALILNAALDEGEDEYEKLVNYIRAKGEVFGKNLEMVRLYFNETRGVRISFKAGLDPDIKQLYERFLHRLGGIFRRGIEKGIFAEHEPYDLAVALDGLTNAFIYSWVKDPENHPYEQKIESIVSIFFGSLLAEPGRKKLQRRIRNGIAAE